tara:strand:+ start:637 stop:1005 length:369 start_codon:yes stop_codon:yes gene_type:complete
MKKTIALLLIVVFTFQNCATLLAPKKSTIAVTSEPRGADVIVNGYKMGVTPVELSLDNDKDYTIEYRKEGYEKVVKMVGTKTSAGWIILDVLFGLVPVIVDAATGDWKKLDTDQVNVMLEKE